MKKITNFLIALMLCIGMFSINALADDNIVFELYQKAVQKTTNSGSWTESLTMIGNMSISKGTAKTKTKVTLESLMNVENYSVDDTSELKISGDISMNAMNQTYAWNVKYENGIAHYEYTEPTQSSTDVEISPSYFNFDTLTYDMLKNAKISNNKISFTISEDQMKSASIAAVNLMPGIENLHYEDVDVDMMINPSTEAIDTVDMKFHASMTYQGYNTEVDYIVNYQFISRPGNSSTEFSDTLQMQAEEIIDGMVIYSDYTNLSVRKDSSITLSAGVIIDGKKVEDTSGITFWVEDPSILESKSTGVKDNCRYVKLNGISEGFTFVGFSDSNTGYSIKVPITVYTNNYLSYTLSSVPTEYIEKYPTNIYNANGLYVDNYRYVINDDQSAKVSFDVYNTNYTYGIVEVFNSNGELKDAVLINKMTSSNTSIKTAVWDNVGYLISDFTDGDLFTYRQESGYSKHTPVSVKIPKNGYIKISNDPENSFIVGLINSADFLFSVGDLTNEITNFDINSPEFSKKLTLKLVKEKAFAEFVKDGNDMAKKLWKNVSKDVLISSESLGDFSNTIANNIDDLDLGDIIVDTATDIGVGIGENIFKYFSGPVGKALNVAFFIGKAENIIIQYTNLINSSDVGSIYIQNQGGGFRASQQITVESSDDFSENTSLNVFKVELDTVILDIIKNTNPTLYQSIKQGTNYTYNISLLDKGNEIQPNGSVAVHIPIPNELKPFAYTGRTKIFRVSEDGQTIEMDVKIEGGCFVFETDHFSIYTIIGSNEFLTMNSIILMGIVFVIILMIFIIALTIRRKKKQIIRN